MSVLTLIWPRTDVHFKCCTSYVAPPTWGPNIKEIKGKRHSIKNAVCCRKDKPVVLYFLSSGPQWKEHGQQNVGLRLGHEFRSGNWTHNFSVREKDANHYTIRSSLITKPTRLHQSIQLVLYAVSLKYICIDYNTIYFYILVCQVIVSQITHDMEDWGEWRSLEINPHWFGFDS